jgi:glycerol-3-phosphate dehydrogenase (NAD(P)+)
MMRLVVLGAGAWGTALASAAACRHEVLLWARDAALASALARDRCNARYLAGVPLAPGLQVTADWAQVEDWLNGASGTTLAVVATPMGALREMLRRLPPGVPVIWLCKGFEAGSGALGHEISRQERPGMPCGVLSGPSFAMEVARQQPTALVAASTDAALIDLSVAAFHNDHLRIYSSEDPVGVEVGGAVKNVLAIATGMLDGLAQAAAAHDLGSHDLAGVPGLNARAALITRGLAEMTRLGVALGAQPATFMGLSGLGDLVLTATGDLSRNRQVGLQLARGLALPEVLRALGHVAEGVYSADTVVQRARLVGIEMPITEAVNAVLQGELTPQAAARRLMAREARPEADPD